MSTSNPVKEVHSYGQSIWLDYIRRRLIESGKLDRLIKEDGVRGITSNPSIFDKAIGGSQDYDEAIEELARQDKGVPEIYEALAIEDVRNAADRFRDVYDEADGQDGFVSLEVSPHLAHDTEATVAEARRLWNKLDRPNVLIKVPATVEGLPAIRQLISEGINVNVTLLFNRQRYREVADAYIAGLEDRLEAGQPIDRVASVASFFLSRIDVAVDPVLEEVARGEGERADKASACHGQVAVSYARLAYQDSLDIFGGERFAKLADQGAHQQRVLWASTSTKNPDYSDVKYVEALIGPKTINTIPMETLDAYRDHGDPAERVTDDLDQARRVIADLDELGVDLDQLTTRQLVDEGVDKFVRPFDQLMDTLAKKRAEVLGRSVDHQLLNAGEASEAVDVRINELAGVEFSDRLWRKDPTLWTEDEATKQQIRRSLGWLHVAEKMQAHLRGLQDFAQQVRDAGYRRVVHMGMGGSSLAPLAFARIFDKPDDAPELTVLDTTDPDTICAIEEAAPFDETLFIVASKSGTTAETRAFCDHFYERVRQECDGPAGDHFVTVTDPGSPLAELSEERDFRRVFTNFEDIGGRYSALSFFGLVPAAAVGLDVDGLLGRAMNMAQACAESVEGADNPGVALGAFLGELANEGRDKVTFMVPDKVTELGMWLEQLLAESTGKEGKGLVPVAGEPLGPAEVYGDDRVFVHMRFKDAARGEVDDLVDELAYRGHPVAHITLDGAMDIAQEFLRWEIAAATAGRVLGINPFDQPNVQESKDNTNRLLDQGQADGELPDKTPSFEDDGLAFYVDGGVTSGVDALANLLETRQDGDYFAIMAYLSEQPATTRSLQEMRHQIRDAEHLATTLGYGPRFLHSTGQLHKGGPNTGIFLQLTADANHDADVPGQWYSFESLRRAQAQGDLEALREHDRRVIRVDLGDDVHGGLDTLDAMLTEALSRLE